MSAPAPATNSTIDQEGSRFGDTRVTGGLLVQGNVVGATINYTAARNGNVRPYSHTSLHPIKAFVPRPILYGRIREQLHDGSDDAAQPKMAQGSPEGHGTSNQAGVEGFNSRIQDVNFAMTRFLETASTAIESPTHSPWASPTDIAQASTLDGNLNYNDDSDLDRSPTLAKQDYKPEIQHMLAQEQAHTFTNEDGQTALHLAAKQDAYLTRDVLSRGFDINLRNIDGETPLMCAVSAGNVDTMTLFLKNHADVNEVDDQRATCLHLAALRGESGSTTQLPLRRNPDIEIMDAIGLTPLFLAAFNDNDAVVHQLLKFGAKLEAKDLDGFNALHYACMQANHGFMSRLLDKSGPDFEAFYELSTYGLPADSSHSTISKRRVQIVRSLLTNSADVHAPKLNSPRVSFTRMLNHVLCALYSYSSDLGLDT